MIAMKGKQVIEALGALAHEHRLAVYRLLVEAGPAGLSAGAIAEALGVPPSSLTFHTQALVRAGLATQRRLGRQLIYAADFDAMTKLVGYLTENCCSHSGSCAPVYNPAKAELSADIDRRHTKRRSA
ncbi:MAG: transcriptional regulator [Alphaproteobacteria bacterium 62-8]|nr:MAG: transcriptional regulator [Alphaproteobacteria bacterium 62-8]